MGKVRLRKFKKFAPYNHRVHLFYVFANSVMFFTVYTQLVLNQCQLTRPNWPKARMLAFCCPGLEETEYRQEKRYDSGLNGHHLLAWAPFPSISSSWEAYIQFTFTPKTLPPSADSEPTWKRFTSMQTGATYTFMDFRFCQALKGALQSFCFPKYEWRLVGCVSMASELQLFLSI